MDSLLLPGFAAIASVIFLFLLLKLRNAIVALGGAVPVPLVIVLFNGLSFVHFLFLFTAFSIGALLALFLSWALGQLQIRTYDCESMFLPWISPPKGVSGGWLQRTLQRPKFVQRLRASVCEILVKRDWFPSQGIFVEVDVSNPELILYDRVNNQSTPEYIHRAPGQQSMWYGVIGLLIAYALINVFWSSSLRVLVTPPLLLVLVGTLLSSIFGFVAFVLDRYRIPMAGFIAIWMFFVYISSSNRTHQFETVEYPESQIIQDSSPTATEEQGAIAAKAESTVEPNSKRRIVITAPGGGIHAAAWTAEVLTRLQLEFGREFTQSISDVSAVSGGSLGCMFFFAEWDELQNEDKARVEKACDRIRRNSQSSSLEDIGFGVAYSEVLWSFLPYTNLTMDSGRLQEARWSQLLSKRPELDSVDAKKFLAAQTLRNWSRKRESGNFPRVTFNATEVETGQRVLFSNWGSEQQSTHKHTDLAVRKNFLDLIGDHRDISVLTAARMSATFPYVTPIAEPDVNAGPGKSRRRIGFLADGGYGDNEGMNTAIEAIRDSFNNWPQARVLLIRIIHEPAPTNASSAIPISTYDQFFRPTIGPLETMFNTRIASQSDHAKIDIQSLKSLAVAQHHDFEVMTVEFRNTDFDMQSNAEKMVLSWKLTPAEKDKYQKVWKNIEPSVFSQYKNWRDRKGAN